MYCVCDLVGNDERDIQAKVYEEDFKTEREDRARAFSEREKEGEEYREEIEHLQIQLNISTETQKELMKAMDDLIQAKTSEVETYKKQQDELLAKVSGAKNIM